MRRLMILIAAAAALAHAAGEEHKGRVVKVGDGDTLTLQIAGRELPVRLDGIDAPEIDQPYGRKARRSLTELCGGKEAVVLERGRDEAGRILGAVRCGEHDANAEQVRRGMAWVHLGHVPVGSALYEFEAHARLRQMGLWREAEPVPPWEWRQGAKKP